LNAELRNAIATPRGDDRVVRRGRPAGDVSPGVDDQVHIERRQSPVAFYTNLGLEHFSMARILPKAMLLRRNQSHGASSFAGKKTRPVGARAWESLSGSRRRHMGPAHAPCPARYRENERTRCHRA